MPSDFRPVGVYTPLVTPFSEDDRVDLDALERLAAEVIDEGAAGIVALATTGEATSLTADERDAVIACCASVCVDKHATLIVGAGTNDTRTTIERHEALAHIAGASASLAVVPYYVRPSEQAIVRHFELLAERSPVPVLIYNIPYRTGRGLGAESLLELAAVDGIAGAKQAVGGIDGDTLTVLASAPDGFAMLAGDDLFIYPLVLMGGRGAIAASAQIATGRFAEMVDAGLAGRIDEGRTHHEALLPLAQALFAEPSPAVLKAVLYAQGRIATPDVRMPLANATEAAAERALAATP
ncbi:MAG: 4-hydroxy-tetrahydrodipicolinate synthase [Sphingomonadales bacterium]|nr:4-hydroxy-tetrahydrodipicolinate synthase [Sphingomonadales bacterium]